jgi:dTDP-D-glucose 4,6-dehydratase
MNEKMLVIGACGFVGSNFIRKSIYNKYPYQLVGLDRISYKNSKQNIYQHSRYKFYLNDFADVHYLRLILEIEKPSKILFAAQPVNQLENNFYYGSLKSFFDVISEFDAEKKIQVLFLMNDELWTSDVYKNYIELNLNISLCFTSKLFGPRQNFGSFLPTCLDSQKRKVRYHLKSDVQHNWMFIDDLCSGINLLFQDWGRYRNCFLESNWNLSKLEMGKEIGILLNDLNWYQESKIETDSWDKPNLQKISWPAQEKFQICLKKTIEWYQKNQWFMNSFGEFYK